MFHIKGAKMKVFDYLPAMRCKLLIGVVGERWYTYEKQSIL